MICGRGALMSLPWIRKLYGSPDQIGLIEESTNARCNLQKRVPSEIPDIRGLGLMTSKVRIQWRSKHFVVCFMVDISDIRYLLDK